jgi:predicted secreted hydrolase
VLVLLPLLLFTGCTANEPGVASANVIAALSGMPDAGFARAYAPRPFTFPADHGAHPEYQTEWWYYTGNLTGEDGRLYGYQFTLFRNALSPEMVERPSTMASNQVYMAHFALTDVGANRHTSFERYSRGAAGLAGAEGEPTFRAWLEDWEVVSIEPGLYHMQVAAERDGAPLALDLILQETRPPLLHGDAGLSQKGPEPGNASYYYSLVHMATTGSVTSNGRTVAVEGQSWMDHEFGTSALSENALGWDWFSMPLDNGAAIMFAQIRTSEGGRIGDFEGTIVHPDGRQEIINADDFHMEILEQWTSPRTGITYPSGWRVSLPRWEAELEVQPLVRDQEMMVSLIYWEGAVAVEGMLGGEPVSGRGYVELTGYGSELGRYER